MNTIIITKVVRFYCPFQIVPPATLIALCAFVSNHPTSGNEAKPRRKQEGLVSKHFKQLGSGDPTNVIDFVRVGFDRENVFRGHGDEENVVDFVLTPWTEKEVKKKANMSQEGRQASDEMIFVHWCRVSLW